jgi:hypothetical protein
VNISAKTWGTSTGIPSIGCACAITTDDSMVTVRASLQNSEKANHKNLRESMYEKQEKLSFNNEMQYKSMIEPP